MEDEKIIDLFFARSEQAIHELDTKYGKVCHKLSYNILQTQMYVSMTLISELGTQYRLSDLTRYLHSYVRLSAIFPLCVIMRILP